MQKGNEIIVQDYGTDCKNCERYQKLGDVCLVEHGKKFTWEYCRDFDPMVVLPDYKDLMKSVKMDQALERKKLKEKKEKEKRKRLKEREARKELKKKKRRARLRKRRERLKKLSEKKAKNLPSLTEISSDRKAPKSMKTPVAKSELATQKPESPKQSETQAAKPKKISRKKAENSLPDEA